MKYFCHNLSDVQSNKIGEKTTIWQLVGFINKAKLLKAADKYGKSGYGQYINKIAKNNGKDQNSFTS